MNILFQTVGQRTTKTLDNQPHIIIPIRANGQGLPPVHLMNGAIVTFGPLTVSRVTPRVIESQGLGRLYNCRRSNSTTIGELWISQRKAHSIAPQILTGELHIEAIVNNNHLSYVKVIPMRTNTTNRKQESKQPESFDTSRWLQLNSQKVKEVLLMQDTNKIEVLEMPQSCYSAKSSDIALVRSNLVAVLGNEQGTRRLAEMTAHEITTAANALVDNSGNGGCCRDKQIANLKPATVQAMALPDYSDAYKGVNHGR